MHTCGLCQLIWKWAGNSGLPVSKGVQVGRVLEAGSGVSSARGRVRRLGWYGSGMRILLDVARGLAFLHNNRVSMPALPCFVPPAPARMA